MRVEEEKYIAYLNRQISNCKKEEQNLLLEERQDDANFSKIRCNIYEIAKTLFVSAKKQGGEDRLYEQYLALMQRIPKSWEVNREQAKKHGRMDLSAIEETKLAVVDEVMSYLKEQCIKE